jgi:hypothetical protein
MPRPFLLRLPLLLLLLVTLIPLLPLSCASGTPAPSPGDASLPRTPDATASDASRPDATIAADRPRSADAAPSGDAAPAIPFAAVQAILQARCVRCHDPAHPFVLESPTFVALDLTTGAAYGSLVGKPAHEPCGGVLVTPGDPTRSYLFHKVNDEMPCDGVRMPHGGMLRPQPLPAESVATIAAWIRGGAAPPAR